MTAKDFDIVLERRICELRDTLGTKAGEYATDRDRFHNFTTAAGMMGGTPAQAAWGFMVKHIVSMRDMIVGDKPLSSDMIDEKLGDVMAYTVLIEGMLREQLAAELLARRAAEKPTPSVLRDMPHEADERRLLESVHAAKRARDVHLTERDQQP